MIVFVCGNSCTGKSTFIKKNFPNFEKVDVYDFQKKRLIATVNDLLEVYKEAENMLLEKISKYVKAEAVGLTI